MTDLEDNEQIEGRELEAVEEPAPKSGGLDEIAAQILDTVDQIKVGPKTMLLLAFLGAAGIRQFYREGILEALGIGVVLIVIGIAPILSVWWLQRKG